MTADHFRPEVNERQQADMNKDLALFELVDEFRTAELKLRDLDLDDQTISDTLEGLRYPLEQKATNIAKFVQNLEASAEAIKNAEAQMSVRRKAIENRAARIREYLKTCMVNAEITRIECPYFVLAIRANPPKVEIEDQQFIPLEFMRQKPPPPPEPDKTAIAQALKAGLAVPGARLAQSNRVEIR